MDALPQFRYPATGVGLLASGSSMLLSYHGKSYWETRFLGFLQGFYGVSQKPPNKMKRNVHVKPRAARRQWRHVFRALSQLLSLVSLTILCKYHIGWWGSSYLHWFLEIDESRMIVRLVQTHFEAREGPTLWWMQLYIWFVVVRVLNKDNSNSQLWQRGEISSSVRLCLSYNVDWRYHMS